jgi:hypothetical protein
MKSRRALLVVAVMFAAVAHVYGLNPPSKADGPIKLLTCAVDPRGMLDAEVENQTNDTLNCNIRCSYELSGKMFSHSFNVTIAKRFQGRVGGFDTSNAKPGNYPGDVGTCEKVAR